MPLRTRRGIVSTVDDASTDLPTNCSRCDARQTRMTHTGSANATPDTPFDVRRRAVTRYAWLKSHEVEANTLQGDEANARRYIKPALGDMPIRKVTAQCSKCSTPRCDSVGHDVTAGR